MIFEKIGAKFASSVIEIIEKNEQPRIYIYPPDEVNELAIDFGNVHGQRIAAMREVQKSLKEKMSELKRKQESLSKFLEEYESTIIGHLKANQNMVFSGGKYGLRLQNNGGVQPVDFLFAKENVTGYLSISSLDENLFDVIKVYKPKKETLEDVRNGVCIAGFTLLERGEHLRIV